MKRLLPVIQKAGIGASLLFFWALPGKVQAQEVIAQGVDFTSPQSWAITRYGDKIEPDLYTGTMIFNLPIYTYSDTDFNIPVSIGYASNGLMPNVQTGPLGLGWFLNAGGVISREVVGIPDEALMEQGGQWFGHGFITTHMEFGSDILNAHRTGDPSDFWNNTFYTDQMFGTNKAVYYHQSNGVYYELTPDLFHFSFMGYKGTFMFGFDEEIHFFNTNFPEGEITIKRKWHHGATFPAFELITGNGYAYLFGIYDDNPSNPRGDVRERSNNIDRSWMLTRITAPNGRTVEFAYGHPGEQDEVQSRTPSGTRLSIGEGDSGGHQSYSSSFLDLARSSSYVQYLKAITIDNKVDIWFDYSIKPREKAVLEDNSTVELLAVKQLDRIRVNYGLGANAVEKKRYALNYYPVNTAGNPVLLLHQVVQPDGGIYEFDYYNRTGSFPMHGCYAIDHWGYYNGTNTAKSTFLPSPIALWSSSYDENLLDTNFRLPNPQASLMGMLKEVVYPTKGKSSFTYEANTYSQQVERSSRSGYIPDLFDASSMNKTAGGLRIKTIGETDNHGNETIREFYYAGMDVWGQPFPESSGNLLKVPRYSTPFVRGDIGSEYYVYNMLTTTSPVTLTVDKTHIEYSHVTERRNDGSKILYEFSNYDNVPDERILEDQMDGASQVSWPDSWVVNGLFADPYTNHHNRGKLLNKIIKDADNKTVYKEEYNYDSFYNTNNTFVTWQMSIDQMYPMHVKLQQDRLNNVQRTEYRNGTPLVTQTSYGYNRANQVISEKTFDSRNREIMTRRQFVADLNPTSGTYFQMKNANVIRYPLHERMTLKEGNSTVVVGGTSTDFNVLSNSIIRPSAVKSLTLAAPQPLNESTLFSTSGMRTEIAYTYDAKGNVIQTDEKGKITSYVWGYDGLYLVAKVENAPIGAVATIVSNIRNAPLSGALSTSQESSLRAIRDVLVTTCTYTPLVGITSMTDPSGRKVTHGYDDAGRLEWIKDDNGHLIESYEYNYAAN